MIWRITKNLNYPNHIRHADGGGFILPSSPIPKIAA
jgi:hypothetical protein